MPINLAPVSHGRQAIEALSSQIAQAKADDPLAPVTVVLQSHAHDAATRRELARMSTSGLAGVEFVTLPELAERIAVLTLAEAANGPLLPATRPVLNGMVRKALIEEPGIFDPIKDHPATAEALASTHSELREVADDALAKLAATGQRAAEVVRVHRAVNVQLEDGWFDSHRAIDAATAALADGPQPESNGSVFVYLPEPIPSSHAALLQALAEHTEVLVLAAASGDEQADARLAASLDPLGLVLETQTADVAKSIEILTTADADDEVRFVVRSVVDALRDGVSARRIAVVFTSPEPYARLLAEQFRAAGVEFHGPSGRSVRELSAARFLLGFVGLDPYRLRRSEFFGLLSSAPIRTPDGDFVPLRRWRHIGRKHYTNGSIDNWVARLRDAGEEAAPLAEFVKGVGDHLQQVSAAKTWSDLIAAYFQILRDYLPTDNMPQKERSALAVVRESLGNLEILDSMGIPPSAQTLNELLELATERRQVASGTAGTGVRVLSITQAVGLDADVVIVCGCVEGLLPHRPGFDPLLPTADRATLRDAGAEIRSPRESVPRQHRDFLAAIAAAGSRVVLTMPRGDLRRTTSHIPSRWLLEIASALVGADKLQPREFEQLMENSSIRHIQSFGSGIASLTEPATAQEFSILEAARCDPVDSEDAVLARNAELTIARRAHKFTRFDGNLAGAPVPAIGDLVFSATGLEEYVKCPHGYFLGRLLRVRPLEADDEQRMTPLDRGSLVHEVLERFINDALPIEFGHVWTAKELAHLAAIADEVCDRYESEGRTGHPLVWSTGRPQLIRELTEFITHEQERRRSLGLSPKLTELKFGYAGDELEDFAITLPGGGVKLRGSIDRVDVTKDGNLAIHDYKTGKKKGFSSIKEDDPLGGNSKLQLPLYGFAARAAAEAGVIEGATSGGSVTAGYWFFGIDSGARADVALTEHVDNQVREVLGSITDLIARGVFPQRPPTTFGMSGSDCDYCAPNGRGIDAVRESWSRIENDPLLADYLRLAKLVDEDEGEEQS